MNVEKNFVKKEKEHIFEGRPLLKEKYNRYMREYRFLFPCNSIYSKDYRTTIIRDLIIYYLYQEKKKKMKYNKLTYHQLADLFNLKSHSAVLYSVKKIEDIIEKPQRLTKYNTVFNYLYYRFNKILNMSNSTPLNTKK